MMRDKLEQDELKRMGWRVIVVWECNVDKISEIEILLKSKA